MKSDSSLVTPKIRLVKPWLTKSPFQPVTGSMYHCQHQIKPYEGEDIRGGRKVVGWEKKNLLTNTNDRVDSRQRRTFVKR